VVERLVSVNMLQALPWLAASYFVGAIPTSYLVARGLGGIDLRTVGSRNLGATNLYRVMGWKYAVPVGLFDMAKGAIPVWFFGPRVPEIPLFPVMCGAMAVIGHVFSVFVRFRGGKGVATAAGVIAGLAPVAFLVVAAIWVVVVRVSGYVSLGSVIGASVFPLADWLLQPARRTPLDLGMDLVLAGIIVWKHRTNLKRLIKGTEHRFGRRGKDAGAAATPTP
jgi:glycerol-3-phosphate acyltransferase PlsY